MNYYEKHIGDYIRDTVSLTMTEDGAYGRLMDQVYQSEKPLPLDKKMVYRLARATSTADRKAVDFVLATFFLETANGFVQKRIEREIEKYQEKQRKAKASANARWNKVDQDANASQTHDASDMRTHCEGNAHQTPDTKHQTQSIDSDDSPGSASPLPRIGEICQLLRRAGINTGPNALAQHAWTANPGATNDLIETALAIAKKNKAGISFTVNYLRPIMDELLNPPPGKAQSAGPAVPPKKDWL